MDKKIAISALIVLAIMISGCVNNPAPPEENSQIPPADEPQIQPDENTQIQPAEEPASQLDIAKGTANMVKCMAITENDRIAIITDNETLKVGEEIKNAAEEKGAKAELLIMEDYGTRPMTSLPQEFAEKIRETNPTVSVYAASTKSGELPFRKELIDLVIDDLNVRHAHMPNITEAVAGGEAMCADYDKIIELSQKVFDEIKDAKTITVTGPGTDLTASFDYNHDEIKWVISNGQIRKPGDWENLPDGEVFTTPLNINGKITTTVLGDYFTQKYGVMNPPVTVEFENGYVKSVSCENKELENEIYEYAHKGENTDRVGEFAIGTNYAITRLIGNILADEKAIGMHVAIGDSIGSNTGAKWSASQHCDMVVQGVTIAVDGKTIMQDGQFTI